MKTQMIRLVVSLMALAMIGFGCGASMVSVGFSSQVRTTRVPVYPKHRPVVVQGVISYDTVVSDGHYVDDVYYTDDGDIVYGQWVRTDYPDGEYVEVWEVEEDFVDCDDDW